MGEKASKKQKNLQNINEIEVVLDIEKGEKIKVIIELTEEKVDLVNFVKSVLEYEDDSK